MVMSNELYEMMVDDDNTIEQQAWHALALLVHLASGGQWQGPVTREAAVIEAHGLIGLIMGEAG